MAINAARNHAAVLPAKLQKTRASTIPETNIALRAIQYLPLISSSTPVRRFNLAICLSSCSRRFILVICGMNISSKSPLEQLKAKAAEWNVTLEETRETLTSLLGFGVRERRGVVLKITKYDGDESNSGRILQAFAGDGAVRVYEFETGAVL